MTDREPTDEDYKWAIQDGLTDAENRELAGYLGICWHEWVDNIGHQCCNYPKLCKHCYSYPEEVGDNPDFSDSRMVLREMRKRKDWKQFREDYRIFCKGNYPMRSNDGNYGLCINLLLDTTGLLAKAALEWFRSTPSSPRKSR